MVVIRSCATTKQVQPCLEAIPAATMAASRQGPPPPAPAAATVVTVLLDGCGECANAAAFHLLLFCFTPLQARDSHDQAPAHHPLTLHLVCNSSTAALKRLRNINLLSSSAQLQHKARTNQEEAGGARTSGLCVVGVRHQLVLLWQLHCTWHIGLRQPAPDIGQDSGSLIQVIAQIGRGGRHGLCSRAGDGAGGS